MESVAREQKRHGRTGFSWKRRDVNHPLSRRRIKVKRTRGGRGRAGFKSGAKERGVTEVGKAQRRSREVRKDSDEGFMSEAESSFW